MDLQQSYSVFRRSGMEGKQWQAQDQSIRTDRIPYQPVQNVTLGRNRTGGHHAADRVEQQT